MTLIIAEIAQAHDGSLGTAHAYIDALASAGVGAVKFQTHIAEAESSYLEPFRVKFSQQDKTRFDYWRRMEFTLEEWKGLKQHCEDVGVEFMSSPFSNAAVDLLEEIGVKRYKIGSGEVNNLLLLERISKTKKPIIISSGMSSFKELDNTVMFLKNKSISFSIMQCTTSYPTFPEQYGFNVINELKQRYGVSVGFSDHSARLETSIAAVALGADFIECHAVFHKKMFGPDVSSSLTIDEFRALVEAVSNIDKAISSPVNKNNNATFKTLKTIFEKSLSVNKPIKKGHIITFDDLEAKKPANQGIKASYFEQVIGKKAARNIEKWEFLKPEDIL